MTFKEECEELDTFAELQKKKLIDGMDFICAVYYECRKGEKYEKNINILPTHANSSRTCNNLSNLDKLTWTQTQQLKKLMKSKSKSKKHAQSLTLHTITSEP